MSSAVAVPARRPEKAEAGPGMGRRALRAVGRALFGVGICSPYFLAVPVESDESWMHSADWWSVGLPVTRPFGPDRRLFTEDA
ncbi:hypothetical protein ACFY2W_04535 [Streptomyces sp. NPDC001262]|uniref:hypothetical protein n=1 Tax=Streptomyces sp. NPDC001262 TaxID=3364552 RepID=UPI0036878AA9